jgi:hypothetical protein
MEPQYCSAEELAELAAQEDRDASPDDSGSDNGDVFEQDLVAAGGEGGEEMQMDGLSAPPNKAARDAERKKWTSLGEVTLDRRAKHHFDDCHFHLVGCPDLSPLGVFRHILFEEYIRGHLLPLINKQLTATSHATFDEYLRFLGILFAMAAFLGDGGRSKLWELDSSVLFRPVVSLAGVMTKHRFEILLAAHRMFALPEMHAAGDMTEITRMEGAFNEHMLACCVPGSVLTVDESQVAWRGRAFQGMQCHDRKPADRVRGRGCLDWWFRRGGEAVFSVLM